MDGDRRDRLTELIHSVFQSCPNMKSIVFPNYEGYLCNVFDPKCKVKKECLFVEIYHLINLFLASFG